jgi:hypothetical protein
MEMAEPTGGDLRALLLRRQAADLEQASRMIIESGRIDEVIDVARQYAGGASAAIPTSRLPHLCRGSRLPMWTGHSKSSLPLESIGRCVRDPQAAPLRVPIPAVGGRFVPASDSSPTAYDGTNIWGNMTYASRDPRRREYSH